MIIGILYLELALITHTVVTSSKHRKQYKHCSIGAVTISDKSYTANISMLDQYCFNVVDQRRNNVDPTLKMKQNSTSDFQRCTTLIQRRCPTLKQRWYNFILMLLQRVFNSSKSYIKTSRASGKYGFVNL